MIGRMSRLNETGGGWAANAPGTARATRGTKERKRSTGMKDATRIAIPGMGAPENPVEADEASIARGAELFQINCRMCHGQTAEGNGPIAPFLRNKPANLTSPIVQSKSDGSIFLTISNGVEGKMPPLNENLLVHDRWDLVNFIRTLTIED
jgi:mono/diheme cytochrome c family protein